MTWKVAPALAAGNTVVVKPSEETPATATLLGEVMNEVGVPPGVYNVVHGFGPGSAGEAIVKHPDVCAITFTGESATGTAIMKNAADHIKEVSFELGGKNPALVFADCDFEKAVAGTVKSVFSNCGQVCLCTERVYVERSIYDRFVDELAARAAELRRGDPYDASTGMGPLISEEHRNKVSSYFELAKAEGAEVVCGGREAEMPGKYAGGWWVEPTIWTGLDESARCIKEEVFGPVCHIQPFDSEDEAVAMANDSDYGLAAAVWTENVRRAHRVAQAVDCGIAWVNTWFLRDLRTPFGGVKASGIGREGGQYSLNFYTELKNICIKL
jgi:aminomuconate-semialdehyde/2-hydroxymuconate-6-semialdehyde dehydrogenase